MIYLKRIVFLGMIIMCVGVLASTQAQEPFEAVETLNIWPDGAPVDEDSTEQVPVLLHVFLPDASTATGQGVVICPGGGYGGLCVEPEGYGIAKWLNQYGIAGFVLEYRLPSQRYMVPLFDAQRAIRVVRNHAEKWNVSPNKIGIIGFSAGGHLASTAVTHFDSGNPEAKDLIDRMSCRPDFGILVYPVVTMKENSDQGTRHNLLGGQPSEALVEFYSNELHVGPETPPVFLAHALDDEVVPISNSQNFVAQMKAFERPFHYVELAYGNHGLQGYQGPMWDQWQNECIQWMKNDCR